MTRTKIVLLLAALMLAASCTPPAPAPVVTPQGEDRYLIDPRIGFDTPVSPALTQQFETAWRYVLAGNETEARKKLAEILKRDPSYAPAQLASAVFDIHAGRFVEASTTVAVARERNPDYLAARVYEAEIALRDNQTRAAYDLYRQVLAQPNAPATAGERMKQLEEALFNELFAAAQSAPDTESIRLLREALTFHPSAAEPRIQLAQKLVAQRQFDEARREIDPLLNTIADRPEIQQILAEVEVGRGRYQEAIVRYERLAKQTKDPHHEQRLQEIKREWRSANMPPHVRAAMSSTAVTRAELATLLYWTVPSVRFAQNVGTPMIAVDIEDVAGREEIIRAIALGLFDVDPVTRRVSPHRVVTASRLSSFLARVLTSRGAACARGSAAVLGACGVNDPLATYGPDAPVTGADAVAALEQVAKQL
ncbi:MAG TPA: tetratricopeptide repeat protein [Thermoanaerobaculia bacterium]|nr:tetratricopeptide repeat protein [Thermoanaerobaculia bacterium]